ncbi:MAG: hypothetical protein NTY53_26505 [Kiritimatiellaeota bacterium]|nr:hypothetical protein [Kiritimatiellota bacterium]
MKIFLTKNKYIYRFIPIHRLWHILSSRQLYFLRNTKWDDPFEGFLVKRYCDIMGKKFSALNADKYFMCCTRRREKDHFWRNYTPNRDGVVLSLHRENLIHSDSRIVCRDIKYPRIENLKAIVTEIDSGNYAATKIPDLFFMKRYAFEDEVEVRLMIQDKKALQDVVSVDIDPSRVIHEIMFDSRMDHVTYREHSEFIKTRFGHFRMSHSTLYNPERTFPKQPQVGRRSA